jgi:hypothetical protein
MNNTSNNISKIKFPYVTVNIIYLLIVIIISAIMAILYVYVIKPNYKHSTIQYTQNLLLERSSAKEEHLILSKHTPVSLYGNEYNLSMWIKILNYNSGEIKYILKKSLLIIYLHPTMPNMHVKINKDNDIFHADKCDDPEGCVFKPTETTKAEEFENIADNNELKCINESNICNNKVSYRHNTILDKVLNQYSKHELLVENFNEEEDTTSSDPINEEGDECIVYDIPLQKWVHISINFDSDVIDIYLDSKLVSSCKLENKPDINLSNTIITPEGGFDGEVSKLIYTSVKLNSKQIYKLYKEGP